MWLFSRFPRKVDLNTPFPATVFLSTVSLSTALYLSLVAFPRIGIFVAMFSGLPIVLAQIRYPAVLLGTGAMVTSGGIIFLLGMLIHAPLPGLLALVYAGWCGLPALVTAEFLKRGFRVLPMVLASSLQILFFLGAIGFFLYSKTHGRLWEELQQSILHAIDLAMKSAIQNSQMALTPSDQSRLAALEPMIYRAVIGLLPGVLTSLALMTALIQWAGSVASMERMGNNGKVTGIDRWYLPDYLIFALIASLAFLLVPTFGFRLVGANLSMVFGVLYAGQGVGVLLSYIRRRKLGSWFWLVAGVFVLLQPIFLLIFSFVGVLDLWFDFRQIRGKGGQGGSMEKPHDMDKNIDFSDKNDGGRGSSDRRGLFDPNRRPGHLGISGV